MLLNPDHTVNWQMLKNAPEQLNKRKILETILHSNTYLGLPAQNNQLDTKHTLLFRNRIT